MPSDAKLFTIKDGKIIEGVIKEVILQPNPVNSSIDLFGYRFLHNGKCVHIANDALFYHDIDDIQNEDCITPTAEHHQLRKLDPNDNIGWNIRRDLWYFDGSTAQPYDLFEEIVTYSVDKDCVITIIEGFFPNSGLYLSKKDVYAHHDMTYINQEGIEEVKDCYFKPLFLSDKQAEIVKKLNEVLSEMNKENMGLVADTDYGNYFVVNTTEYDVEIDCFGEDTPHYTFSPKDNQKLNIEVHRYWYSDNGETFTLHKKNK